MSDVEPYKIGEPVDELPFKAGSVQNAIGALQQAMEAHPGKWIPLECTSAQVATKRRAAIQGARWFKALGAEIAVRTNTVYVRIAEAT